MVCRAAFGAEVAPIDPNCAGAAQIFVGSAVFIDGARPDVAGSFPASPANTRAGWGFMVLTNMLPSQGNGTFQFFMWAQDREGHAFLLGTRTMTCANASATLPFGAIDTPEQGGPASGSAYVNFGWALTPLPKTIPIDGSTISVLVDGVTVGTASYNNFRPDIAALFPGLNNSNGAVGFRVLDTTTLTNGTHTISWVVSDNQGATEGIGSRFFTVSNGAASLTSTAQATPTLGAPTGTRAASGQALLLRSDSTASYLPLDSHVVLGRSGWNLNAPLRPFSRDTSGRTIIRSEEVSRVELQLGAGPHAGYLRASDGPSPLPVGSHLEPTTGVFTWAPGVGFVGTYDFVFTRFAGERPVARQEDPDRDCTKGQRIDWPAGCHRPAALATRRGAAVRAGRVVGGSECDSRYRRCDAACMGLSVVRWSTPIPWHAMVKVSRGQTWPECTETSSQTQGLGYMFKGCRMETSTLRSSEVPRPRASCQPKSCG